VKISFISWIHFCILTPSSYFYVSVTRSNWILLGQLGCRDTLLLKIKVCKMQIIVDHLKVTESKVICCWHMCMFLSSFTSVSHCAGLKLSKSPHIIIYCNKIFRTTLDFQTLAQHLYNTRQHKDKTVKQEVVERLHRSDEVIRTQL